MSRVAACAVAVMLLSLAPVGADAAEQSVWGVGFRAGSFGIPNQILDRLLEEHPSVSGAVYGAELRYYGNGGQDGVFSAGLTFDYGTASADGTWRKEAGDVPTQAEGEVSLKAVTLTLYFDILPSLTVHPYVGLGLGYGLIDAGYTQGGGGDMDIEDGLPVVHLPIGLAVKLGPNLTFRAEARIIDAVSFGGQLMVNF